MNFTQKLAARLLGFEYVAEVWMDAVYVRRVRRIGKYMVLAASGGRIYPGGRIAGQGIGWEPLTPGAKKFYGLEVI